MRQPATLLFGLVLIVGLVPAGHGMSLREAYDLAGPDQGYDKYVELETGVVYTGGLLIGPVFSPITWELEGEPGLDVCIVGNGAILDLQGGQLCLSYCNMRLDIEDCIVLRGNIRYRGMNTHDHVVIPEGSVRYVTFYDTDDYGIRLQGAGDGVHLERNIFVNAIDTGYDFMYTHGASHEWLPTGMNLSFSIQAGFYGTPAIRDNWSFHTDPEINAQPLAHYGMLCEYG